MAIDTATTAVTAGVVPSDGITTRRTTVLTPGPSER
jgi:hypothetical protein